MIFLNPEKEVLSRISIASGAIVGFGCRAPNKNTENEDSFGYFRLSDGSGLLVVADGAGGHSNGDKASRLALKSMEDSLKKFKSQQGLAKPFLDSIKKIHSEIQEKLSGAGTTLVAAHIRKGELDVYHVGDSQLMLMGGRGKLKFETVSHSPLGFGKESGALSETELEERIDSSTVSSLLGFDPLKIEMNLQLEMSAKDRVILGSDGLFDVLSREEILEMATSHSLEEASERMSALVLERMESSDSGSNCHPDDLTFLMYGPA